VPGVGPAAPAHDGQGRQVAGQLPVPAGQQADIALSNINATLYREYQIAPSLFFHDVTGAGHLASNNGLFPAVPGYDLATGIGTIKMAPFIIGSF